MIVTLTLNPSLDRTIEVAELVRGAMVRAGTARLDPGGKGVNVSRALAAHGVATRVVLPRSGPEGERLTALLAGAGIDVAAVPVSGATRSNVALTEPDGTVTKINESGSPLRESEVDDIVAAVQAAAVGADWVVASGSLPPGVPDKFYARLCQLFADTGVRVAVDTSGPALKATLTARPALVKPNREELTEAAGYPVETLGDAVRAAQDLRTAGAGAVLASLAAHGAVLVDEAGVSYGRSTVRRPRSSVGAGDAMLAGFLATGAAGPKALAEALSWGAAAVALPGSRMPGPIDVGGLVHLHPDPDLSRSLRDDPDRGDQ